MLASLDGHDRKILDLLQKDSSITNVELARQVGLAPATTLERVRKLEQNRVIRGYVALVDPSKVNQGLLAFVSVSLAAHRAALVEEFREGLRALPEVLESYFVSGEYDYLLKVVAADMAGYEHFALHKLAALPNVGRVHTLFVLSTVKHDTQIPIQQ